MRNTKPVRSKFRGSAFYARLLRNDPCAFCGKVERQTIDHIHPTYKGGLNHWMNFTAACSRCNNRKGTKSLMETLMGLRQGSISPQACLFSREIDLLPEKWYDPLGIYPTKEQNVACEVS